MYCQLDSHTCTHTVANTRAINIHKNARHIYIHISGAYLGLTANIQVGAVYNILTMSQTHSILDACGSPRYEPAYLATKYITKKKKKTDPSPSPLPTPITSGQYVFRFQSPYALLRQMAYNFPFFVTFSSFLNLLNIFVSRYYKFSLFLFSALQDSISYIILN